MRQRAPLVADLVEHIPDGAVCQVEPILPVDPDFSAIVVCPRTSRLPSPCGSSDVTISHETAFFTGIGRISILHLLSF